MSDTRILIKPNNLLSCLTSDRVCTAFGIKLITSPAIVHLALSANYDTLFIDHEHSSMSLQDASNLCITALSSGITPFVRVPFQCGDGYVQKILDGGAMGIIFPHVNSAEEARRLSRVCKYPPLGSRSWTTGLPHLGFEVGAPGMQVEEMNRWGSTVFVQIESSEAVKKVEEIAAVEGVDVLLVGSNDLALEMGILGDWENPRLIEALKRVGNVCKLHHKCFGIAGVYNQPALMDKIVNQFGARYVLSGVDVGLLGGAMRQNLAGLKSVQRT